MRHILQRPEEQVTNILWRAILTLLETYLGRYVGLHKPTYGADTDFWIR